jgi:hypothetical protein
VTERAAPAAALLAAVVLGGTVAGGLVAAALLDGDGDGDRAPSDAEVATALANAGLDGAELRCAIAVLGDDEPLDGPAPGVCSALTTSTSAPTSTTEGALPDCTGAAGADPAAVEVCAVDGLVALLTDGTDLDAVTASCAAQAVVDELGVDAVVAALESGVPPPDLRERLQAAFVTC